MQSKISGGTSYRRSYLVIIDISSCDIISSIGIIKLKY